MLLVSFWDSPQLSLSADGAVSYVRDDAAWLGSYLQQHGYLPQVSLLLEATMSIQQARWWCDRRSECAGFSLQVDTPPSAIVAREEEENLRTLVRFFSSPLLTYMAPRMNWLYSWVSFTKVQGAVRGRAANAGADPSLPVSWLLQPGFIVSTNSDGSDTHADNMLRSDEQATLQDALEWCSASDDCEGVTAAAPPAMIPIDRLQTACYCCHVEVRTNRAQLSLSKWSPSLRPGLSAQQLRPPPTVGAAAAAGRALGTNAAGTGEETLPFWATQGYLAGGVELHSAFVSVDEALAWCSRHPSCAALTAKTVRAPASVLYIRFVSRDGARPIPIVHHPEWITWSVPGADEVGSGKEEL